MTVRIRLARHGQKNTPFYHIVAINGRRRRDALPIEKLGEYDPIPRIPSTSITTSTPSASSSSSSSTSSSRLQPRSAPSFNPSLESMTMKALFANGPVPGVQPEKKIVWNTERIKWWLANGAQPSETVVKLLEKGGVLTGNHKWKIPYKRPSTKPAEKTA